MLGPRGLPVRHVLKYGWASTVLPLERSLVASLQPDHKPKAQQLPSTLRLPPRLADLTSLLTTVGQPGTSTRDLEGPPNLDVQYRHGWSLLLAGFSAAVMGILDPPPAVAYCQPSFWCMLCAEEHQGNKVASEKRRVNKGHGPFGGYYIGSTAVPFEKIRLQPGVQPGVRIPGKAHPDGHTYVGYVCNKSWQRKDVTSHHHKRKPEAARESQLLQADERTTRQKHDLDVQRIAGLEIDRQRAEWELERQQLNQALGGQQQALETAESQQATLEEQLSHLLQALVVADTARQQAEAVCVQQRGRLDELDSRLRASELQAEATDRQRENQAACRHAERGRFGSSEHWMARSSRRLIPQPRCMLHWGYATSATAHL